MLRSKAHLKAWLKFADDKALREQALAGARKLDHRTSDAVEMLNEDEYTAQTLLEYLSVLDLDATSRFCEAAQNALHIIPPGRLQEGTSRFRDTARTGFPRDASGGWRGRP
jgi:hypothetical protein